MEGSYISIFDSKEVEVIYKHSKFIGNISYVKTKQEAISYIRFISNKYKDATHNVSAYNLFCGGVRYYNDDKEPSKTAGKPILDILEKEKIFDVCVVVSRYFGGTLLGTGGLVLAYGGSCKKLLEKVTFAVCYYCLELYIKFEYKYLKKIENNILNYRCKILGREFGSFVELKLLLEKNSSNLFISSCKEATSGNITLKIIDERWERLEKKQN